MSSKVTLTCKAAWAFPTGDYRFLPFENGGLGFVFSDQRAYDAFVERLLTADFPVNAAERIQQICEGGAIFPELFGDGALLISQDEEGTTVESRDVLVYKGRIEDNNFYILTDAAQPLMIFSDGSCSVKESGLGKEVFNALDIRITGKAQGQLAA